MKVYVTTALCIASAALSMRAFAFEVNTHAKMTERAVSESMLPEYLRQRLNFADDIDEVIQGTKVLKLISDGSKAEDDDGLLRFCNHFHDPAKEWSEAGLSHLPDSAVCYVFAGKDSSIVWGQKRGQGYSWQEARDYFLAAVTEEAEDERSAAYARLFRAIG